MKCCLMRPMFANVVFTGIQNEKGNSSFTEMYMFYIYYNLQSHQNVRLPCRLLQSCSIFRERERERGERERERERERKREREERESERERGEGE